MKNIVKNEKLNEVSNNEFFKKSTNNNITLAFFREKYIQGKSKIQLLE